MNEKVNLLRWVLKYFRRRHRERKGGWTCFSSFTQWFALVPSLHTLFIFLSFRMWIPFWSSHFLSASSSINPLLPLVNTHYGQQTQWQFSPSAIWDQYWVSSTTNWPDILISVIQPKCYAFCPPSRRPTVYSPSEWLKSNAERKHTFTDDYL